MTRSQDEGELEAMRDFYERRMRNAPPEQAERIRAYVAALEMSLQFPRRAALFNFLATAHPRAFASFARRRLNGQTTLPDFHDLPAGTISQSE